MAIAFEPACQAAVDLAKRSTADGQALGAAELLAACYWQDSLRTRLPDLSQCLPQPKPIRDNPGAVPVAGELQPVLGQLAGNGDVISVDALFQAILQSPAGQTALRRRGAGDELIAKALAAMTDGAPPAAGNGAWRVSPARAGALQALSSFGRMLTDVELPGRGRFEGDGPFRALVTTLSKMKRHNAIIVGHPGTGKTALIYELARLMRSGDEALPPHLREMDIFELSPAFLRSGASVVGQYEERVKQLLTVLTANPKIILFVDEVHSLFQSGVHQHGPFSDANEAFKGVLSRGEVSCIGCTTWGEYRHYIEPDGALTRRFEIIRLEPPTARQTAAILRSRLPRFAAHFAGLEIPDDLVDKVVELTDDYLPSRYQPDKSIQLLDHACALAVTDGPSSAQLTEEHLVKALEHTVGHQVVRSERLTEDGVCQRLSAKIIGQETVLPALARAFVGGLGSWKRRKGPRGVYLFGGPTGTGKTETALVLGRLLGGDRDAIVRVDCNVLQGTGGSGGSAAWRLLGVPQGYVGYARGQGGLLSAVRDMPECVVLFDEFEKADASVGEVLLRIMDEGKAEDIDGNLLDFRRCYLIFTTNAGCRYEKASTFGFSAPKTGTTARVDKDQLFQELRGLGLGQEFLARFTHTFMFQGLSRESAAILVRRQLHGLTEIARQRGFALSWDASLEQHLATQWQPHLGVRFLSAILRNRVIEQLSLADAQGELREVSTIVLRPAATAAEPTFLARRTREGQTLFIELQ